MPVKQILKLGNPDLYRPSTAVSKNELESIKILIEDLHDTMMDFRNNYKRGRAIAAPQIAVFKRVIYMNINNPIVFINPELTDLSSETIEVWDDCMSFPDLLVKVRRHRSCKIQFLNLEWKKQTIFFKDDLSELIQHEYDHLNGILAVQRAIDGKSFALLNQKDKIR
jgi:peptide deformylase